MSLINGRSYSWSQIRFNIMNVPITGISEITYEEEQEKEDYKGAGTRGNSRGVGSITSTGSITLSMNEIEKLRDASVLAGDADGSLLSLPPFDIIVSYTNAQRPVKHVLKKAEFTKDGGGGAADDTTIEMSLDLIISKVQYR